VVVYGRRLSGGSGPVTVPYYQVLPAGGSGWSTPAPVVTNQSEGLEVTFAFDSNNTAHAVWYTQDKVRHLRESSWPGAGTVITTAVGVRDPNIAIGGGRVHVVWAQGSTSQVYHAYSVNNGATWITTPAALSPAGTPAIEPVVAVDQTGNVHVAWEQQVLHNQPGNPPPGCTQIFCHRIYYKKGTLSGGNYVWDATFSLLSTDSSHAELPTILALDNTLHVTFAQRQFVEGEQAAYTGYYRRRLTPTSSWSAPVKATGNLPLFVNTSVPRILVGGLTNCGPDVVYYYHGGVISNAREQIWGTAASDNWSSRTAVTDEQSRHINPSVACASGKMHLVFERTGLEENHQLLYVSGYLHSVFMPAILRAGP
jgi:hypothetical protein